jgi:hypothetical protein
MKNLKAQGGEAAAVILGIIAIAIIAAALLYFYNSNASPVKIQSMMPNTISVGINAITQSQTVNIIINNSAGYSTSLAYVAGTCTNNTNSFSNFQTSYFAINSTVKQFNITATSSFNYLTSAHIPYSCLAYVFDANKGNNQISQGFIYKLIAR